MSWSGVREPAPRGGCGWRWGPPRAPEQSQSCSPCPALLRNHLAPSCSITSVQLLFHNFGALGRYMAQMQSSGSLCHQKQGIRTGGGKSELWCQVTLSRYLKNTLTTHVETCFGLLKPPAALDGGTPHPLSAASSYLIGPVELAGHVQVNSINLILCKVAQHLSASLAVWWVCLLLSKWVWLKGDKAMSWYFIILKWITTPLAKIIMFCHFYSRQPC